MLGQAAFTFVLLVFILNRREDLRNRMIRLLGQGQVTTTTKAVDETSRPVSKFQLVAAAFWAFMWGPVGLILSGPLTVCLLVLGKYVPQWRFLNVLLGDQPVLSPQVAFYQRLAARDHDEAADILEKELSTRPVEP